MLALKPQEELMMRYFLPSLAAVAICAFGLAATAAPGDSPQSAGMERMQQWAADHQAMLDARLAGLKAGLKLTPDQEKLWPPFETAVRDAAKLRMDQMKAMMMDRMQKMWDRMGQMQGPPGQGASPVDSLDALAQRMLDRGAAIKKVADAAKPLYASLDDSQERLFGLLGQELLMMGHGHHGMGMMGGPGLMGEGGMGMMGREPRGTNMMGNPPNDEEDSSDEE
jgi:hypothetical protein